MKSSHTRQLLIEKFTQYTFTDRDGKTLQYNLYVPEKMEKGKNYPLVLFMHDAGTVSPEVKATLSQGRGAVTWVEPEWQKEHPCFVLAPQYGEKSAYDDYTVGWAAEATIPGEDGQMVAAKSLVMNQITLLRADPDLSMSEEGALMIESLPNESAKMALTVITMTPVLAFYPFFQKYFVKGLTLGAVKG